MRWAGPIFQTCFSIWSCNSLSFFEELAMLAISRTLGLASCSLQAGSPSSCIGMLCPSLWLATTSIVHFRLPSWIEMMSGAE